MIDFFFFLDATELSCFSRVRRGSEVKDENLTSSLEMHAHVWAVQRDAGRMMTLEKSQVWTCWEGYRLRQKHRDKSCVAESYGRLLHGGDMVTLSLNGGN